MTNTGLHVKIVPVTPFQQNCSVLVCTATRQAVVVDPGGEIDRILEAVKDAGASVVKILVTHAHVDHAGGVAELAGRLRVPVEGPQRADQFWIDQLPLQGMNFGISGSAAFTPDRWLEEGDTVTFGRISLDVHHCPGHTPGHVIFFHPPSKLAIVGDVLFQGSIGRTDFPRGDYATLIQSIQHRLWPLGNDVQFIPGHGPMSTIGYERRTNPFVADHV
jgi:glyoxylase-like metal-dependent hydrolase (beta-lactamase superfamily II)